MVKKRESNNESYINIQSPPADPIFVYDETLPLINLNGQSNYNPKDHMMTMPKQPIYKYYEERNEVPQGNFGMVNGSESQLLKQFKGQDMDMYV